MGINEKVKNVRLALELDFEGMASLTGLSKSYISMLETGDRKPSRNVIDKYLEIAPDLISASDFFTEGTC